MPVELAKVSMLSNYQKLYGLLSHNERRRARHLVAFVFFVSLFDIAGVASIFPLISVVSDTNRVYSDPVISLIFAFMQSFGSFTKSDFIFLLGMLSSCVIAISFILRFYASYLQINFVLYNEYSISARLTKLLLNNNHSASAKIHSSEHSKLVLSEVNQVCAGVFNPMISLLTQAATCLVLFSVLMFLYPAITSIILMVFGGFYLTLSLFFKNYLMEIGSQRVSANKERYFLLAEALGSHRERMFYDLNKFFLSRFEDSAFAFSQSQAKQQYLSKLPKFMIEIVAFVGLTLFLTLSGDQENIQEILPMISVFAYALYKVLPGLQVIYTSANQLRFHQSAAIKLVEELESLELSQIKSQVETKPLKMLRRFEMRDIDFSYSGSNTILSNVNLVVNKGEFVAIVGESGSGKSTLLDCAVGLLRPSSGTLMVDGRELASSDLARWRGSVGYVPQKIHLIDGTVAENIALGVDRSAIDIELLQEVCKLAKCDGFVNALEYGFETPVGELGCALSGGQCQRLAIARALYKRPSLLILDESTNALDPETEHAVLSNLKIKAPRLSVLLISHSEQNHQFCDVRYLLDSGKLEIWPY